MRGEAIFYSSVWKLFYPLFLYKSQRQLEDNEFYQMLEEIRFGMISDTTWTKLIERATNYNNNQTLDLLLTTTHIVGYCEHQNKLTMQF